MLSSWRSPAGSSLALPAPGSRGLWPNPRGFPSAPAPSTAFFGCHVPAAPAGYSGQGEASAEGVPGLWGCLGVSEHPPARK